MPQTPYFIGVDKINPIMYPVNAGNKAVTAPTAQWTYGAWNEVVSAAGLASNFVLCGAVTRVLTSVSVHAAIELGTGGSGSEVTLDKFSYYTGTIGGVVDDPVSIVHEHAQLIGPHFIAAGTRIAARQAQDLAASWKTTAMFLYGFTVASPAIAARVIDYMSLTQGFATKGGDRLPTTDFVSLTHSGAAWTDGAWVEIVASTTEDLVIEGITLASNNTGRDFGVKLGVGAAGSEVYLPCEFPAISGATIQIGLGFIPCPFPIFIPKGSRIAALQEALGSTGTCKIALKVTYLK